MKAILVRKRRTAVLWASGVYLVLAVMVELGTLAADVSLEWNPNPESDVIGYRIHYGETGGSITTFLDAGNATNLTVTGLQEGVSYTFYASAYNTANLESELSTGVSYTVPLPGENLAVTWDRSFSASAYSYALLYSISNQTPTTIDAGTNLTATIPAVERGATYLLTVEAYDSTGNVVTRYQAVNYTVPASGSVGSVHLLPIDNPPLVELTAPTTGSNYSEPATIEISANASDDDAVKFVDFFAGTNLLARISTAPYLFSWQQVPAGNYEIHAVAIDSIDQFTASDSVSVAVAARIENPPAAPSNLNARYRGWDDAVLLTWNDRSDNENSFAVERSTDNLKYTTLVTLGANATSYSDADVAPGLRYYYRVRAINGGGSNVSSAVSARTRG